MICKLQRPIFSNDPSTPWLLYNQDRSIEMEIPDKDITTFIRQKMGHDYKAYWNMELKGDELSFIKRAPEQVW